jgi:hypothetical protein
MVDSESMTDPDDLVEPNAPLDDGDHPEDVDVEDAEGTLAAVQ